MFEVGDIVRLRNGKSPQRVERVIAKGKQIICQYLSTVRGNPDNNEIAWNKPRFVDDFILYEEETEMTQIYQLIGIEPKRFGVKIGQDSRGQIILEMKGENGKIEVVRPNEIEVVIPYTVRLRKVNGGENIHLIVKKGLLELGDIVIERSIGSSGYMYMVDQLDSKCQKAVSNPENFSKVLTQSLGDN